MFATNVTQYRMNYTLLYVKKKVEDAYCVIAEFACVIVHLNAIMSLFITLPATSVEYLFIYAFLHYRKMFNCRT